MQTLIKKQLKNWAISCASLIALTCIAPANAQTLEFASVFPESDFSSLSVKHWTEGVTKATDGRIKFRIHWSGRLVGNKMVDAMRDGVVEQIGSPLDLYDHPANQFVAGFIGSPSMNFLPGVVRGGHVVFLKVSQGRHRRG